MTGSRPRYNDSECLFIYTIFFASLLKKTDTLLLRSYFFPFEINTRWRRRLDIKGLPTAAGRRRCV